MRKRITKSFRTRFVLDAANSSNPLPPGEGRVRGSIQDFRNYFEWIPQSRRIEGAQSRLISPHPGPFDSAQDRPLLEGEGAREASSRCGRTIRIARNPPPVIPAKAGIQGGRKVVASVDLSVLNMSEADEQINI
jgi:hypothetical protein